MPSCSTWPRFSHMWRESSMDFPPPELWRFTIDTTTGKVREEQVDDRSAEFPRVADSVIGLKHRFGYMMSMAEAGIPDDPMSASGAILKYDRETGARSAIEFGRGRVGGEAVFAPSADPKSEDDGYLMTFLYDAHSDSSRFVIMDAAHDGQRTRRVDRTAAHSEWLPRKLDSGIGRGLRLNPFRLPRNSRVRW